MCYGTHPNILSLTLTHIICIIKLCILEGLILWLYLNYLNYLIRIDAITVSDYILFAIHCSIKHI